MKNILEDASACTQNNACYEIKCKNVQKSTENMLNAGEKVIDVR